MKYLDYLIEKYNITGFHTDNSRKCDIITFNNTYKVAVLKVGLPKTAVLTNSPNDLIIFDGEDFYNYDYRTYTLTKRDRKITTVSYFLNDVQIPVNHYETQLSLFNNIPPEVRNLRRVPQSFNTIDNVYNVGTLDIINNFLKNMYPYDNVEIRPIGEIDLMSFRKPLNIKTEPNVKMGYFIDGYKFSDEQYAKMKNDIFRCSYCGKMHLKNYTEYKTVENITICNDCYYNQYTHCDICGKLCLKSDLRQGICSQCYGREREYMVQSYNYKPTTRFYHDDGTFTTSCENFKGVGIELEIDGGGESCKPSKYIQEALDNRVYVKHDGSLQNGFEIITHPHTIKAFNEIQWEEPLLELIKHGYRSHDIKTCGLHMHISRNMLTKDNIAKLIYFVETHKYDLVRFSRRDLTELEKWSGFYTEPDGIRHTPTFAGRVCKKLCYAIMTSYNDKSPHDYRYKALNLRKKETIEFRFLRGTLNYKTFKASLDFLLTLVKNCKKVTWKNIDNTKMWLEGIEENTISYMKKRKCFGYTSRKKYKECDI